MSIFDLFTGNSGQATANNMAMLAAQGRGASMRAIGNARPGIMNAYDRARGLGMGYLNMARQPTLDALKGGYRDAARTLTNTQRLFDPYASQGLEAWNALGDASGLGGARGYDRATAAFRASPGYEWQRDQAIDAVQRSAGASGMLASGNTMAAIADRSSALADQEYGDYIARLQGLSNTGYNATGAQAGIGTSLSSLLANRGTAIGNFWQDDAARRAALVSGVEQNRAGTLAGLVNPTVNAQQNSVSQMLQALQYGDQAQRQGDQNALQALLGIGTLGASFAGSPTGYNLLAAQFPSLGLTPMTRYS